MGGGQKGGGLKGPKRSRVEGAKKGREARGPRRERGDLLTYLASILQMIETSLFLNKDFKICFSYHWLFRKRSLKLKLH